MKTNTRKTGVLALVVFWLSIRYQVPILTNENGLTPTNSYLEYLVMAVLGLALVHFVKNRKQFSRTLFIKLSAAIFLAILAEYTFTLYAESMDNSFVIGHFLKLLSLAIIYDVFVKKLIDKPFEILEMKLVSYEAIPNPTLILNPAGDIVHVNDAAARLINIEKSGILTDNVHQLFHDTSIARKDCFICSSIREQQVNRIFEIHHPASNRFFILTLATIALEDEPILFVQSMVDISTEKGIELRLKNSKERYQSLVSNLPIGVFETDASGECTFVNKEWQLQSGLDFNKALGTGWKQALHPQDQLRIFDQWNNHIGDSKPWDLEYRFLDADNNVRNILAHAVAQYNEQETLGKNPRFLKSGNTSLSVYRRIWKSLLSGEPLKVEIQNKKKSGELYWENSNYSIVKDEHGSTYKYLSIKEDISERIEAKKELYQQANYDLLTGLANRFKALQHLKNLISDAREKKEKLGLLVVNIDGFKKNK